MPFLEWLATAQTRLGAMAAAQAIRAKIQNDPYYRFQSISELEIAASLGITIDANQASVDDWLRLPGLSIHQARALVELTQSGVQLHSLEDVSAVLNLPAARIKPWERVLRFCYYDPASCLTIQTVNPNTATVEMLMTIPGVDLYLARAIVANRATSPYRNLIHLQRRLALPAELVSTLMYYLRF